MRNWMTFALLILLGVGLLFVSCRDNSEELRKENIKLRAENDSLRVLIAKSTPLIKKLHTQNEILRTENDSLRALLAKSAPTTKKPKIKGKKTKYTRDEFKKLVIGKVLNFQTLFASKLNVTSTA